MTTEEKVKNSGLTEDEIAFVFYKRIKQDFALFSNVALGVFAEKMVETNAEKMKISSDVRKFGVGIKITATISKLDPFKK